MLCRTRQIIGWRCFASSLNNMRDGRSTIHYNDACGHWETNFAIPRCACRSVRSRDPGHYTCTTPKLRCQSTTITGMIEDRRHSPQQLEHHASVYHFRPVVELWTTFNATHLLLTLFVLAMSCTSQSKESRKAWLIFSLIKVLLLVEQEAIQMLAPVVSERWYVCHFRPLLIWRCSPFGHFQCLCHYFLLHYQISQFIG